MWPFSKTLDEVINAHKKIKLMGVKFIIKKIDPTTYVEGSKVMLQLYEIYKGKSPEDLHIDQAKRIEKVKSHYRDVFLASVVEPRLSRADDGSGIFVDNLFTEWDLANGLYEQIISYSYGKKKSK